MIETCIMAIDPGVSGAVAFYFPGHDRISVEDIPVVDKIINGQELAGRIKQFAPTLAVIEDVHAMPKQGVTSMFNFGRSFGTAIGVTAASFVPLRYVAPSKWKRYFGLSADKEEARALAINLFPHIAIHLTRKKDAGRAEAALMARYAAEVLLLKTGDPA